ncbi:MAG: ATP-binding protein [Limnochordales bacterium]|nr:ATP-binding protein [Limnochordales bacterium]
MAGRESLKKFFEERLPELKNWDFPEQAFAAYLSDFEMLLRDAQACQACQGREQCKALTPGHPLRLHEEGIKLYGEPAFAVAPCARELERRQQQWLQAAIKSARLRRSDLVQTFATFRVTPQNRNVFRACLAYATQYRPQETDYGLILLGPVGTGKSHLASAILNHLRQRHVAGLLKVDVSELLSEMRNTMAGGGGVSSLLEAAKSAELLVLDDLGQEYQTEWARSVLGELINARYLDRRPLIVTTNLDLEALTHILTERVASRLLGMSKVLVLEGSDFRIRQHRILQSLSPEGVGASPDEYDAMPNN